MVNGFLAFAVPFTAIWILEPAQSKDTALQLWLRITQLFVYSALILTTISVSLFQTIVLRGKVYLYFLDHRWKLLGQYIGLILFMVMNIVHVCTALDFNSINKLFHIEKDLVCNEHI